MPSGSRAQPSEKRIDLLCFDEPDATKILWAYEEELPNLRRQINILENRLRISDGQRIDLKGQAVALEEERDLLRANAVDSGDLVKGLEKDVKRVKRRRWLGIGLALAVGGLAGYGFAKIGG